MSMSEVLQRAEQALGAASTYVPVASDVRPIYPRDVSDLPSEELGRLLGVYAAVLAYLEYEAARWQTESNARKACLDYERAKSFLRFRAQERTIEDAKQLVRTDSNLVNLTQEYEEAAGTARLVEALLSGTARQYSGLSRELSRRGLVDPTQSGREPYGLRLGARRLDD